MFHGLHQGPELVFSLLKLILRHGAGHDSTSRLGIEAVVFAEKGADCDGLVDRPVEPERADTSGIGHAAVRLKLIDKLHGAHFRSAAEGAGGQCLPEKFVDICVLGKFSHDAADHVDYVGVELYLLEIFHVHPAAAAAEVVAGKVYEHDMLGVLFGVIEKFLREFMVAGVVACATECPGYRVDVCLPVCSHAEMSLRRRAEYLEIAEIEEKQIGEGLMERSAR